ncbi:PREDICTED: uncharacterized protein LOC105507247 [Colobus angolensis palliatus]|uniref:uncharacterized protein LOC105507247 n=1 Tax=Colobus angolensis palliatus TaxID=336983 RepID=UPI0005F361A8|nr:PREDICTED: uncharacterized protein LOC105507247 [Colobus angolensis palliatus]
MNEGGVHVLLLPRPLSSRLAKALVTAPPYYRWSGNASGAGLGCSARAIQQRRACAVEGLREAGDWYASECARGGRRPCGAWYYDQRRPEGAGGCAAAAAAVAALRGAGERQAAGALLRFHPAPPRRPHPASTPGPAWGWLQRRRWAALLVLGLLVAGAADGCELVPRHLRGRRATGSATTAASSPAAAAGDSPALTTGEGLGGGGRGSAGRPQWDPPIPCRGQHLRRTSAIPRPRPGVMRSPGCCSVAVPCTPDIFPFHPNTPPQHPTVAEPLDGTGSPPFSRALRSSKLSNAVVSVSCCRRASRVCRGLG